jgi:alpha/beta superfamily hydrolase
VTILKADNRAARRLDSGGAFTEEASFFGGGRQQIFGVEHRPAGSPTGAVVICPSIHAEFVAGYGIDVSLARALASRGIVVQRFHYRGVGHSDGDSEEITFTTMREDALMAAERLLGQAEGAPVAFVGTRFGALVAASAAADHAESPLALIEPTLDAARFFRDAWRAALIRDVKSGTARAPGEGLGDVLARDRTIDLLGYPISLPFYESANGRELLAEMGDGRRILVVQLGRSSSPRADLRDASSELQRRGCRVDLELVGEEVTWWFPPAAETEQPKRRGLVEVTAAWLVEELVNPS